MQTKLIIVGAGPRELKKSGLVLGGSWRWKRFEFGSEFGLRGLGMELGLLYAGRGALASGLGLLGSGHCTLVAGL